MSGRPRNLESPEQLYKLFEDYKDNIKSNPFLVHDFVGKDGKSVYREKEKPLTLEGFENYCYKRVGYVEQYFKNKEEELLLADEMADILFVLICLANQTGVDLTTALEKNIQKKTNRDASRHQNNEKLHR